MACLEGMSNSDFLVAVGALPAVAALPAVGALPDGPEGQPQAATGQPQAATSQRGAANTSREPRGRTPPPGQRQPMLNKLLSLPYDDLNPSQEEVDGGCQCTGCPGCFRCKKTSTRSGWCGHTIGKKKLAKSVLRCHWCYEYLEEHSDLLSQLWDDRVQTVLGFDQPPAANTSSGQRNPYLQGSKTRRVSYTQSAFAAQSDDGEESSQADQQSSTSCVSTPAVPTHAKKLAVWGVDMDHLRQPLPTGRAKTPPRQPRAAVLTPRPTSSPGHKRSSSDAGHDDTGAFEPIPIPTALFSDKQGRLVNEWGERCDALGRLTKSRGRAGTGPNKSAWRGGRPQDWGPHWGNDHHGAYYEPQDDDNNAHDPAAASSEQPATGGRQPATSGPERNYWRSDGRNHGHWERR